MIADIFSGEVAYALAMTLLHSLWQISLIAIMLAAILRFNKSAGNNARYNLALGALAFSLLFALVTFSIYIIDLSSSQSVSHAFSGTAPVSTVSSWMPTGYTLLEENFIWIVNIWLIGSLIFFMKFSGAYLYLKYIIHKSDIENVVLMESLHNVNTKFDIQRSISVKESGMINSPLVIGFLKPVILFPIGLVNMLSLDEVEAILAHELAHIKRHDYIFSLLQSIGEIIFYYHPGIWYISNQLDFHRELCCDDMAIGCTGNSINYARTLVKLQELKTTQLMPALSFSGKSGQFSQRIKRLLNMPSKSNNIKLKIFTFLMIFSSVFVFAKANENKTDHSTENTDVYVIEDCIESPEAIKVYLDTLPEKTSFHVKKQSNEEELEMEMEDGEIVKLRINGKDIPPSEYDTYDDVVIELKPDGEKHIITVMPECDKTFGNVFMIKRLDERLGELDSLPIKIERRMFEFPDGDWVEIEKELEKFDHIWIDSIKEGVFAELREKELRFHEHHFDSILGLLPDKLKNMNRFFPEQEISVKILKELEDAHEGIQWYSDDENGFVIELEKELRDKHRGHENFWHHDNQGDDNIFFFGKPDNLHLFDHSDELHFFEKRSMNVSDHIARHLVKDRLIDSQEENKIELTGKHMKINGDKQPKNIWKKYKEIYEEKTGIELTKKSKLEFEIQAKSKREFYIRKSI